MENELKIALQVMMVCCAAGPAMAASATASSGPALDLDIEYYSRVLTPEGVTREARYKEIMLRRTGHVWVARILPKSGIGLKDEEHREDKKGQSAPREGAAGHTDFNYVVNPRHVMMEGDKVKIDYIDTHNKAVVAIPASEYANVNFDGSWKNAFFLVDPTQVKAFPLSARPSNVAGAKWREREKNGIFERVLWDEKRQIPLVIESGDQALTFYRRVDVTAHATQVTTLPWQNLSGYSQKEFSDYLD